MATLCSYPATVVRHRTHIPGINPEAWADRSVCPGDCGGSSILRKDTGLCERCTARTSAQRKAWEMARRRVFEPQRPRDLPEEPICMMCSNPLRGLTEDEHRKYHCTVRRFSCTECGLRFYLEKDRMAHRRKTHGVTI